MLIDKIIHQQNAAQGNQRVDEVPVVKTKAKMNQILSRGSTTDFGMDSMFQSSRYGLIDPLSHSRLFILLSWQTTSGVHG